MFGLVPFDTFALVTVALITAGVIAVLLIAAAKKFFVAIAASVLELILNGWHKLCLGIQVDIRYINVLNG